MNGPISILSRGSVELKPKCVLFFFSFLHLGCSEMCPSDTAVVLSSPFADAQLISHKNSHGFWTKMDNNVTPDADKDEQVT